MNKRYIISLVLIPVIASIAVMGMSRLLSGCSWGSGSLLCAISERVVGPYIAFSEVCFLLLLVLWYIFKSSTRLPLYFVSVYAIISFVVFLVPSVYSQGGFMYERIRGTETECEYYSQYRGGLYQANCYTDLAKKTNDIQYCYKGPQGHGPDSCLSYFAQKKNDQSVCDPNDAYCLQGIAVQNTDPTGCRKIAQERTRAQCYDIVAEKLNNPGYCIYSPETYFYMYCKENYSQAKKRSEELMKASTLTLSGQHLSQTSVNAGQKGVELFRITLTASNDVAAINEINFLNIVPGAEAEDIQNIEIYRMNDSPANKLSGSGLIRYIGQQPSYEYSINPVAIFADSPMVLIIKGDISKSPAVGSVQLEQTGQVLLANTKVIKNGSLGDKIIISK